MALKQLFERGWRPTGQAFKTPYLACATENAGKSTLRLARHQQQPKNQHCRSISTADGATSEQQSPTPPKTPQISYATAYGRSLSEPEEFWTEAADQLIWHRKWDKVLDESNAPFTKWFAGGQISVCHNSLDRHIEAGLGERVALIHDSPVTLTIRKITYRELHAQVTILAAGLRKLGLHRGDNLLIYMPMIPETIVTMLACCRLGAVHSLVFGGFAARELAVRIKHSKPKVIVSANCGVEPTRTVPYKPALDQALAMSEAPPTKCVIYQRPLFEKAQLKPGVDLDWKDVMSSGAASGAVDCVPIDANHPLYIMYTSGTTGDPKGVVRPCGGHAAALHWSMSAIYGMNAGDTWWAASDLGWVVGHSYICYGPLMRGLTTVLYEGKPVGTPDPGAYFRVISRHGIQGMFTAPTALRAIRKEDPTAEYAKKYDTKKLKYMFVAGEHCDTETMKWAGKAFGVPILDNWWQTETGSPMTCTCVGFSDRIPEVPKGSSGKPVPGWNFKVMREDGTEASNGEMGRLVAKVPLPPGFMSTLHKNDSKFAELYFQKYPGYYDTMDAGMIDSDGSVFVMSRDDDVINVAGHRISTKALEEAMLDHQDLVECAVIGVPDAIKGEVPVGLYVVKEGTTKTETEIGDELVSTVRRLVGPVAAFKTSIRVRALPRTRSGKIARKTIADLSRGRPVKIPGTIEDASVYVDIKKKLQENGLAVGAPDPLP